jgi:shikimate dehydrogenase
MRKFGLIGFPLGHSFSKEYFTGKFERERITDCSYENFPVKSLDKLSGIINDTPELCGLNITIPYKTEVLQYATYMEPDVREIGAANVLKIKRINSKIHISAFNSDINGIKDSLSPYLPGNVKKVLILGTGGSSKAVAYALRKMGLEVLKVSRSRSKGAVTYNEINSGIIPDVDLLVNTTPLGMYPDISSKPAIDYDQLTEKHILFDLVYNPEITSFLKMGQERGCRIISGLKMLYSQAERSWEIWNDPDL